VQARHNTVSDVVALAFDGFHARADRSAIGRTFRHLEEGTATLHSLGSVLLEVVEK
jgi:hypothetical protein